jgi:hypothetical protein
MQNLLNGDPIGYGFFTVDSDGCFRANDGTNSAASATFSDQGCGVISFYGDVIIGETEYILRAGTHT